MTQHCRALAALPRTGVGIPVPTLLAGNHPVTEEPTPSSGFHRHLYARNNKVKLKKDTVPITIF